MTTAGTRAFVSLETAARLTRQSGLPTWAVVPRGPDVTEKARGIARQIGVDVDVAIDSATIAVRFTRGPRARRRNGA